MNNPYWRHLWAFLVMLVVVSVIYSPMLSGKKLVQADNQKARSISSELLLFKDKIGRLPLWTNRNFSGMPAFQILAEDKTNLTVPVFNALLGFQGVESVFFGTLLCMLSMYLFMLTLGADWRIALGGAVAYAAGNYFVDISEAGHNTKLVALAFTPAIASGVVLALKGRYLVGSALTALFTALQIYANHFQITYYTFIILGLLALVALIESFARLRVADNGTPLKVLTAIVVVALGVIVGLMANTSKLWSTYMYQSETIRGRSELKSKQADGLNSAYANEYSLSGSEIFTLMIPNYMGGGASVDYSRNKSQLADLIRQNIAGQVPADQIDKVVSQQMGMTLYRGKQPFVGVPIYLGIILWLLFFVGVQLVPGRLKWWLASATVVSILIAMGDATIFGQFMFKFFPFYNKFRAVSMALGLSQWAIAALAMLGLHSVLTQRENVVSVRRAVLIAAGSVAGLLLLAYLLSGDLSGKNDAQLQNVIGLIKEARRDLLKRDLLRSFLFLAAGTAGLLAFIFGRLKPVLTCWFIIALIGIDHLIISKRSLTSDDFTDSADAVTEVQPHKADSEIMADTSGVYRVLDISRGNPLTNSMASAFHQNVGGYHAARLMIYQELIDSILNEPRRYPNVLNMLNVRYVVNDPNTAMRNPDALGNAWFVKKIRVVPDADAEIQTLRTLNTADEVVIQKKYAESLGSFSPTFDSTATIKLVNYIPDHLTYEYSAKSDQLAVFSEIYYPEHKGWHLYLDGQRIGIIKANYVLRAAKLPAGQNRRLEMKFEPDSHTIGNTWSLIGSSTTLLLSALALFLTFKKDSGALIAPQTLPDEPVPGSQPAVPKTAAVRPREQRKKK